LLAIGGPGDVRLAAEILDLLRLARAGISRFALGDGQNVEIGVVAIRFITRAVARELGDRITLACNERVRTQLRVCAEHDPFAVR
jgi:hypothetical protein